MSRAIASALMLAGLVLAYPPLPTAAYDLRGPGLPKGMVLLVTDRMDCTYKGGYRMKHDKAFRVEILASAGRVVSRQRVTWEKYLYSSGVGPRAESSTSHPLTGRTALFVRADDWSATLEGEAGTVGSLEQPWSPHDVYHPTRRVKIGDSWDVPDEELKAHLLLTGNIRADSAKARMRLVRLAEVAGQRCAVVEGTISVEGRFKHLDDGLKMTGKFIIFRSLRHGLDLKSRDDCDFEIRRTGSTQTGRQTLEYTVRVEKKP
jgi:hypothetical protein